MQLQIRSKSSAESVRCSAWLGADSLRDRFQLFKEPSSKREKQIHLAGCEKCKAGKLYKRWTLRPHLPDKSKAQRAWQSEEGQQHVRQEILLGCVEYRNIPSPQR